VLLDWQEQKKSSPCSSVFAKDTEVSSGKGQGYSIFKKQKCYRKSKKGVRMSTEVLEELKKEILTYNREGAVGWARKAVKEKINPIEALDAMTVAIRQVGDGFGKGELWLPDLVGGAAAMTAAMPIIEEEIKRVGAKRERVGTLL
jgi:methanogenic corrinoid protein MtbC1